MFRCLQLSRLLLLSASILAPFGYVQAFDGLGICAHCGCHRECHKICRLEKEEKKVTIVCYGSECEDFCLPCKSCRGCLNREEVCVPDETDKDAPCSQSQSFVWYDWTPTCAKEIRTKKTLMRKTTEKKIPSYKWVVVDLCRECEDKQAATLIEPGHVVSLPPETNVRRMSGADEAKTATQAQTASTGADAQAKSNRASWPNWLFKLP